jgi:hypothetical protein
MKSKEYLIITPTGKNSLFKEWIQEIPDFDLVLLFYENDDVTAKEFTQYTPYVFMGNGEKYHLIKSFIISNLDFISKYKYIWFPDDDVSISTEDINRLFKLAHNYDLNLCQPSMIGYVSHEITKPIPNNLLRYTSFVEILAPLFNLESLLKLYNTFDLNTSGWGYDWLWPHLLGNPKDKIAIIDDIIMEHTRPLGKNYSKERFPIPPNLEMEKLLQYYNIHPAFINYSFISK